MLSQQLRISTRGSVKVIPYVHYAMKKLKPLNICYCFVHGQDQSGLKVSYRLKLEGNSYQVLIWLVQKFQDLRDEKDCNNYIVSLLLCIC